MSKMRKPVRRCDAESEASQGKVNAKKAKAEET
jgi:hypothetical protein